MAKVESNGESSVINDFEYVPQMEQAEPSEVIESDGPENPVPYQLETKTTSDIVLDDMPASPSYSTLLPLPGTTPTHSTPSSSADVDIIDTELNQSDSFGIPTHTPEESKVMSPTPSSPSMSEPFLGFADGFSSMTKTIRQSLELTSLSKARTSSTKRPIPEEALYLTFGLNKEKIDRQKAITLLEEKLKTSQDDFMMLLLGYLIWERANRQVRSPEAKRAIDLWTMSKDPRCAFFRGRIAHDLGNTSEAEKHWTEVLGTLKKIPQIDGSSDPWGLYMLASLHYCGYGGLAQNIPEAIRLFTLSSNQGHVLATHNLAVYHGRGEGVPRCYHTSFRFYQTAAEQGYAPAQSSLGICYEEGKGVEPDIKMAIKYYKLSADQGYCLGELNLGLCYESGTGVDRDIKQALRYYQLAAIQGERAAQFQLASCYHQGIGILRDIKEAVRLYQISAEQGYAPAQYNLALCYQQGIGVSKDCKKAVELYHLSGLQGYLPAQSNLGLCYEKGKGVEKDIKEAIRLYRLAAEDQETYWDHTILVCGVGRQTNVEGVYLCPLLPEQKGGYPPAQCNLGRCCEKAQNDFQEAIRLYKLAAAKGLPSAQYNLALMFLTGTGVEQNLQEAVLLFRQAANQGIADAQFALAECYERGLGIETNRVEAEKWYEVAAKQGHQESLARRERVLG